MVHVCCVPSCSSRSDRERNLSFFSLPLKNKKLLRQWIHVIGRSNLPVNGGTRICSRHFVKAEGRKLHASEVPSKQLPLLPTKVTPSRNRKPPRERQLPVEQQADDQPLSDAVLCCDAAVNTNWNVDEVKEQAQRIDLLEAEVKQIKTNLEQQKFRLKNIASDDKMVTFYTGFPSYSALLACFRFLGPAVDYLSFTGRNGETLPMKRFRPHLLPPLEEFFLVFVRVRLGLMEQDLGYRFGMSQSTVSRVTIAWINFMYLQFS